MRDLLDSVKKLHASLLIYMDYCSSLSFGSVFQPRDIFGAGPLD